MLKGSPPAILPTVVNTAECTQVLEFIRATTRNGNNVIHLQLIPGATSLIRFFVYVFTTIPRFSKNHTS